MRTKTVVGGSFFVLAGAVVLVLASCGGGGGGSSTGTTEVAPSVFHDEALNYSVEYPHDWFASVVPESQRGEPLRSTVAFGAVGEEDALTFVTINAVDMSLSTYLDALNESTIELSRSLEVENGTEWLIIRSQSRNSPRTFVDALTERNGVTYQITYVEGSAEDQLVFEQILQSFTYGA